VRRFRQTVGTQRYTSALLRKQTLLRAAFVSRPRANRQTEALLNNPHIALQDVMADKLIARLQIGVKIGAQLPFL
jgi:hypothetical protein